MLDHQPMLPSLREARELIDGGRPREARAILHRLALVSLRRGDEPGVAELERVACVLAATPALGAEAAAELVEAWR